MNKRIKKRLILLVFMIVVALASFCVFPTFAKFSNDYTTENDVVGFQFNFDLDLNNIEEYEEVKVPSNSYEIFNVNIFNSTSDTSYYGIWYKMVTPKEITDDIIIARLEDNLTETSGELLAYEDKTISIIIKNNSANDILINIGITSSKTSTQDIEYLGGKYLITGSTKEVDYYYDDNSKKYISTIDSNQYFTLNSNIYENKTEEQLFKPNHLGAYKIEAWSAKTKDKLGSYGSGIIYLKGSDNLYLYIGSNAENTIISLTKEEEQNIDNRIMIIGDNSYISGRYGDKLKNYQTETLQQKCITGKESIECSYHPSGKIFKTINYKTEAEEMPTFDGKSTMIGNDKDGLIKITPTVPTLKIPKLSVGFGEKLSITQVECIDNGNGCHIVKTEPEDTSDLPLGTHNISIMVSDDDGIIYKYNTTFEIIV